MTLIKGNVNVMILENTKGDKLSNSKKPAYDIKEPRQFSILPPFSCGVKKAIALLEQWMKGRVILERRAKWRNTKLERYSSRRAEHLASISYHFSSTEKRERLGDDGLLFRYRYQRR